jgi:integrase
MKPQKPHAAFPLFPAPNGQWAKKIKGKPYYFGSWRADPKGELAIKDYCARIPGIDAGSDHLRHLHADGAVSVIDLVNRFLAQRWMDVKGGSLAKVTYGHYDRELRAFATWVRETTPVAALKPEHFAGYCQHLIDDRKSFLARSRRRIFADIKACFRWGAGNGLCPLPNFGTAFKSPSTTKEAIRKEKARAGVADYSDRIVSGAEIDKLLSLSQPNMKAIILLGINCGLGPADIGRLRWRNIDMATGKLDYPRNKTGNVRIGYLWKRTREALERVKTLKHTAEAIGRDGADAHVFVTKKRRPYYREVEVIEGGRVVGVKVENAISITFGRTAKKAELKGVTYYRLRHTFKTLGKKAKDRDALNLCMGHKPNTVEAGYDHETISFKRVRRVAVKVKSRLWPTPKGQRIATGNLQIADAGRGETAGAAA